MFKFMDTTRRFISQGESDALADPTGPPFPAQETESDRAPDQVTRDGEEVSVFIRWYHHRLLV